MTDAHLLDERQVRLMQVEADIERCQEFLRLHRAAAGALPTSSVHTTNNSSACDACLHTHLRF